MNKAELVAAIAAQAELSKKDSEKALKAFIDIVTDELVKGEKVQLLVLVLSKFPPDLQEPVEIRRRSRPSLSQLPRHRSSKQARH